jgi:hypothetical protein
MNIGFLRRKTIAPAVSHPISLTRTFVETGDERCPLAGIWLRLADDSPTPASDEPERTWPALRRSLLWRAFHPRLTPFRYSIA